jgi:hypothetical protein
MLYDPSGRIVRRGIILSLTALCWLCTLPGMLSAAPWQEETSQHFRVFYVEDADFATAVVEWAEHYYTQIRRDLGLNHVVTRDRVPWLWDQRCRIYLYADQRAYIQATGAPMWSGGMVRYRKRAVYSFTQASSFLEQTLPHELAHILFREFVGFQNPEVPRWLDEGVAQYAEIGRREASLKLMYQGISQDIYLPLKELDQLPVNRAQGGTARLFYAQAVTLVHFFLDRYGSRRFIILCGKLRDGYSLERALSFATSGGIRSLTEMEDAWRQFILGLL